METFTPEELAYLDAVWADLDRASAVFESFRVFLSRKYQLNPPDQFTRHGVILRAAPVMAPAVSTTFFPKFEQVADYSARNTAPPTDPPVIDTSPPTEPQA